MENFSIPVIFPCEKVRSFVLLICSGLIGSLVYEKFKMNFNFH